MYWNSLDWFEYQLIMNRPCPHIQLLAKTSMQRLSVLSRSFRGTVSTISVCRSIFLYATLQCAPRPFDPFPEPPEAVRYWSCNGPEWFSWLPLRGRLLAPKHIQWRWVNSQVLAFPLLFLALFFLCQAKVDGFVVSVPCQMNRFLKKLLNWWHQQTHWRLCCGHCISVPYEYKIKDVDTDI